MSESKLKTVAMDSAGELPDFGNLLLREGGYPHLKAEPKYIKIAAHDDSSCQDCVAQFDIKLCNALPECAEFCDDDRLLKSYIFKVQA